MSKRKPKRNGVRAYRVRIVHIFEIALKAHSADHAQAVAWAEYERSEMTPTDLTVQVTEIEDV